MTVSIEKTSLPGVLLLRPQRYSDARGYLFEIYHKDKYLRTGIPCDFVQDNVSYSFKGVLRGLHYQIQHPQAKLIQVLFGEIFDVAVDVRRGSPNFCQWMGMNLSESNGIQLFIPKGYAHGFYVLSDRAVVSYKCSDLYHPEDEGGLFWNDPDVGIIWPCDNPIVSEKDAKNPMLQDIAHSRLPIY